MRHTNFLKFFAITLLMPYLLMAQNISTPLPIPTPATKATSPTTNQAIFTKFYEEKGWGESEFEEGPTDPGSTFQSTEEYRAFLQNFLRTHHIRSVVDVGCGDWSFSKAINWTLIDYKGIDVVPLVIEKNKKKYSAPNIQFSVMDACQEELPKADLLICKEVLQHLSNQDIQKFLKKIGQYKYCLITNDVHPTTKTADNCNISSGDYRCIDLRAKPFSILAKEALLYKAGYWQKQVLLITQEPVFKNQNSTVLLAILARNKAHVLPHYLNCLDNLNYDKKKISIYINTNNNTDATETILRKWAEKHEKEYASIAFETHEVKNLGSDRPHEWTTKRFKTLALIRNKSLQQAIDKKTDYYFVVDCDNFLAPDTLAQLVSKNKPIIAPLLKAIPLPEDHYSTYFCATTPRGYYGDHPNYMNIFSGKMKGTLEVPLVHCTYLIRQDVLPQLTYTDGSDDYEFVIFSREARRQFIPQFICNEQPFGTLLHFNSDLSLEEETAHFQKSTHLIENWKSEARAMPAQKSGVALPIR